MRVGRRMASGSRGWGRPAQAPAPSLIECVPYGAGTWNIRVANAVGVIRVGGVQTHHRAEGAARPLASTSSSAQERTPTGLEQGATVIGCGSLASGRPLVRRIPRATTTRQDSDSGYRESSGHLAAARGRIRAAATASLLLSGRPQFDCEFEDFDSDIPLNRVLLAAARGMPVHPARSTVRARARRAAAHMGGVGEIRASDLLALPGTTHRSVLRCRNTLAILVLPLLVERWTSATNPGSAS